MARKSGKQPAPGPGVFRAGKHPKGGKAKGGNLRRGHIHIGTDHGHDGMAHVSHHMANEEHGTPGGFAAGEHYLDGGCDHHLGENEVDHD